MSKKEEETSTEATEEQQIEAPAEAPSEPSEVSQPQQFICSVCRNLVVPVPVKTPTGTRYKCPDCKKFMKPLSPEDVKEREAADAKIAPLEIEMTNRVKELLRKQLPRVYGIPSKHAGPRITAIIDTLTPMVATNPFNLHSHIKRYAPGADDRHLESIIATIFAELDAEGYKISGSAQYMPGYGQQAGYPGTRGAYCPTYPPAYPPTYPQTYPAQPGYQQPPRPEPMKIIVDGQEISTDLKGHMAWKSYLAERDSKNEEGEERKKENDRRQELHRLEVQKFQEEIKKIAGEGSGGKAGETLVEVKVGEQTIKVPASIAPLYLNKGESPEIKALKDKVEGLTTKLDDQKEEGRKKETADLKVGIAALSKKIDDQPTFFEQMDMMDEYATKRGFSRSGKNTLDVISEIGTNVDNRAQQMLRRMPGGTDEFKPDVTRTPEERRQKAEGIEKRLEKKEDVLSAEDALVKAASKMR